MDQFKKAQEIAKKSQELQTELAAAAPGFDGKSAEDLSKAFSEAMADAQAKSLAAMNEKMQALYASVGLGGAGM